MVGSSASASVNSRVAAEKDAILTIALGSDDPHLLYRLQALGKRVPLTDLRLSFGYAIRTTRQANERAPPGLVSVTIPPRSLGRLRTLLKPIVNGRIVGALGRRPELLLIFFPMQAPVAAAFPDARVVYVVLDDYLHYGWSSRVLRRYEQEIVARAELVVCVSRALAKKLTAEISLARKTVVVSPNAIPAPWIPTTAPRKPDLLPKPVSDLPRPIAGVIGLLANRIRWDWITRAVERVPQLTWLFVGPVGELDPRNRALVDALRSKPACHFLGWQPYERLREFLTALDLAVVAYNDQGVNPFASPVRIFSHLPFYAPIIASIGCRQLEEFEHLITLCRTSEEFVAAIEAGVHCGCNDPVRSFRWRAAHAHTWDARADDLVNVMRELGLLA
jgi:glycosyltransferase involved in cell wall biosynthesis